MPQFMPLPPCYRFRPTDEELIGYYLHNKLQDTLEYNEPFLDVDLYASNPQVLIGMHGDMERDQESWYFFTPRERRCQNGTRPQRSAGDGFWKAIIADTPITVDGVVIGYKKVLDFFVGGGRNPNDIHRTEWKMHEYLTKEQKDNLSLPPSTSQNSMQLNDCVLCKIYKNQRSRKSLKRKEHPTNNVSDKYENVDDQNQLAASNGYKHQTQHKNTGQLIIGEHEQTGQVLLEDQVMDMINDYVVAEQDNSGTYIEESTTANFVFPVHFGDLIC